MSRLTKRHGKHAVQIGAETRRHDKAWNELARYEDAMEQLEAEIESSDKYIAEYDDSEVQKAWNAGMRTGLEILKGGYEEVYREEYDTAGNYHTWGTQSGHTVVKKGGAADV